MVSIYLKLISNDNKEVVRIWMSTYVQRFPLSVTNIKAQIEVISEGSNNTINVTYTNVI